MVTRCGGQEPRQYQAGQPSDPRHHYQVDLPWETVLTATVVNLTDEEPPYIRSQFNYDYHTYSPLGRTFKVGFRKEF